MKKLSEVTRLTGLSRKALEGYERLGLVAPVRDGENGYRWYDDTEVMRASLVHVLSTLGLERREIKRLLEREDVSMADIADQAIASLETRIRRDQGLLNTARMLRAQWTSVHTQPKSAVELMLRDLQEQDLTSCLESLIALPADAPELTDSDFLHGLMVAEALRFFCYARATEAPAEEQRACERHLDEAYAAYLSDALRDTGHDEATLTRELAEMTAEQFADVVEELLDILLDSEYLAEYAGRPDLETLIRQPLRAHLTQAAPALRDAALALWRERAAHPSPESTTKEEKT